MFDQIFRGLCRAIVVVTICCVGSFVWGKDKFAFDFESIALMISEKDTVP